MTFEIAINNIQTKSGKLPDFCDIGLSNLWITNLWITNTNHNFGPQHIRITQELLYA